MHTEARDVVVYSNLVFVAPGFCATRVLVPPCCRGHLMGLVGRENYPYVLLRFSEIGQTTKTQRKVRRCCPPPPRESHEKQLPERFSRDADRGTRNRRARVSNRESWKEAVSFYLDVAPESSTRGRRSGTGGRRSRRARFARRSGRRPGLGRAGMAA